MIRIDQNGWYGIDAKLAMALSSASVIAHHARPGGPGKERPPGDQDHDATDEVDPTPGRDVKRVDGLLGRDEGGALQDRRQAVHGMEEADHDHHHAGEEDHANRTDGSAGFLIHLLGIACH